MSVTYTREWQLSYAIETVFGTEVSPTVWAGLVTEATPSGDVGVEPIFHSGNRVPTFLVDGRHVYSGDFTSIIQDGKLFGFVLGKSATTGSDPFDHAIEWESTLPSATVEYAVAGTSFVRRYTGCKFNRMSVSGSKDRALKVDFEWLGQDVTKYTAKTSVTPDTTNFPYRYEEGSFTINTVGTYGIRDFTLTYENALAPVEHIGNTNPENFAEGQVVCEATMTITHASDDIWDLFEDGTTFDVVITYTRSASDYIVFTMKDCRCPKSGQRLPENEELTDEVSFKAEYLEVDVRDAIATYPTDP